MMTKTLIRGLILGALALAVSGCYYGPPPSYGYYGGGYYGGYPAYGGYYYGPSASFGYYGGGWGGGWHHDHDWH